MATLNKQQMIQELSQRTADLQAHVAALTQGLTAEQLLWKPAPSQWSIVQVMEHLVKSHRTYMDRITDLLATAPPDASATFRPGWFGNLIYRKLQPSVDGKVKPMPAPGFLRPEENLGDPSPTLSLFNDQLSELSCLISKAENLDIQNLKLPFSAVKLLKISVGDALRFIVAHNDRHYLQMERVKNQLNDKNSV